MGFTTEAIEAVAGPAHALEQNQMDLPVREFIGYDPKGTMSITGQPIERPAPAAEEKPAAVETPPKEDPKEESVTLSKEISAIARKEQAYRLREQKLKARERELELKLKDADAFDSIRKRFKEKDFSAADELGMTYEEYTQYLLKKQEGAKPEDERYRKLETELERLKRQQEESTQKEYEANQALWKAEIAKLTSEGDEYASIRELKAEHLVLQHVNDSFEEDGIELTAEEAAKEIEEALIARAQKFASLTKLKAREPEPEPKPVLGAPKSSPKTITQSMTVTSKVPPPKPLHLMSESEQWEEARRRYLAQRQQR